MSIHGAKGDHEFIGFNLSKEPEEFLTTLLKVFALVLLKAVNFNIK